MLRWWLAVWLALPALACGAPAPAGVAYEDLLAMPAPLRERFVAQVMPGHPSQRERLERIVDFVFGPQGLHMVYEDGANATVAEAWETRRANCLGFTLLFLALAREAGLQAWPQMYEQTLSWRRADATFYRNSHVNTVVIVGARRFTVDVARDAVITRGEPVRLGDAALLANYHNNLAVGLLEARDAAAARVHMEAALQLDPDNAGYWSNAGVLALRTGDADAARADYEHALALDAGNGNALFNLVGMAVRLGDASAEAAYRERLQRVQQADPFHHFLLAVDFQRAGDLANAVLHFRAAIRLHRGDHRLHAALAAALQQSGDVRGARRAWQRAMALAEGAARTAYRARLAALPRD